jgi:hypothetical protein
MSFYGRLVATLEANNQPIKTIWSKQATVYSPPERPKYQLIHQYLKALNLYLL